MNIGFSSRLSYDDCAYPDKLTESVSPGMYKMQTYQNYNPNTCMYLNGPRASSGSGFDVSTAVERGPAMSQKLVDIESVLSNRNVRTSKCKNGNVNPVRPEDVKLINNKYCDNDQFPRHSRLSYPAYNYKEMPINRFYNLVRDPQANIFYDFSKNTVLEAKDNFIYQAPKIN